MDKLNPDAPATDVAEGAEADIFDHVFRDTAALPEESARPFAAWLDECWNEWNEDEDKTVGEVIAGALAYWRGQ
jgi:hypothetical protein